MSSFWVSDTFCWTHSVTSKEAIVPRIIFGEFLPMREAEKCCFYICFRSSKQWLTVKFVLSVYIENLNSDGGLYCYTVHETR